MSLFSAALLGIVQGLTEFLPISSSAHLIIARDLFGVALPPSLDLAFDVACHVGTLLAVVVFFWAELVGMLRALPQALRARPGADGRRIQLIVIGTVPVVIVGLLGGSRLEDAWRTAPVAAVALAVGALILFAAERAGTLAKSEAELTPRDAFVIGVAQAAALIPGVSRSGATIGVGMLLHYRRAEIARFSFLLSVPAILAAAAKKGLELRHLPTPLTSADVQAFAIGMAMSAIVGYATVRFFIGFLGHHKLDVFAWYRLALAALLLGIFVAR